MMGVEELAENERRKAIIENHIPCKVIKQFLVRRHREWAAEKRFLMEEGDILIPLSWEYVRIRKETDPKPVIELQVIFLNMRLNEKFKELFDVFFENCEELKKE
jgi:hypothetical protein